jgi:hypothetical protein
MFYNNCMKKTVLSIPIFLCSLLTSAAHARQELPPPPPGVSSQLQGLFGGAIKPSDKKSTAPLASTKFKSSGKLIITDTLIGSLKLDKAQEKAMREFIPQLIGLMEQAYTQNGFEKNDLSVAIGGLLETCYELHAGIFTLEEKDDAAKETAKKKTKAVIRQMQQAFGSNPNFAKIADKDKQSTYEICTFQMGFLAVNWQQAGADEEKKEAVKAQAEAILKTLFNIDPEGITQSKTGEIVPKPGYKAASPPPETPIETELPTGNLLVPAGNLPVPTPAGWQGGAGKPSGIFIYAPTNLQKGELFSVRVAPLQKSGGETIDAWLKNAITQNPFALGKLQNKPEVKSTNDNSASAVAVMQLPTGEAVAATYFAQTMDNETMRLSCIVFSTQEGLFKKHQTGAVAIVKSLAEADKKIAVREGRGVAIAKLPTDTPKEMTLGGTIKHGIYTGNQMYGTEKRVTYRLYLFPSGEYNIFNGKGELIDKSSNNYRYNPRTGLLDLDWGTLYDMSNDKSDPNDDMCLYGKDLQGNPYIYARSDRGFDYATTTLRYEGPLDRPSPSEEKAKKAIAEAEAKRYKWVTAPGKGIQTEQIQCLLLHTETTQFYNGSGMSISSTYDPYILLKDGTLYNGLPVAPDEMDIARSRRQEPEKWGRWKQTKDGYAAAWPDFPAKFIAIKAEPVFPAPSDLRFIGRYGSGETSGSMIGSSFRLWGVTFTAEGRFVKDERGGYGSNAMTANTPGGVSVNTGYDDDGSFVGASGESFALSNSTKKRPKTDRAGGYSVSGYTITLKLDNGGVVRLPFFFTDKKRESMWFEGAVLSKDDDKKK